MLESIIYIVSFIFLFISFLLFKKSNKKLNIIYTIILEFVFIFCYNAITSYLLNFLFIKINLISLSVVNMLISIFIYYRIKTTKKIQKYYFDIKDLIICIISIIIVLIIGYLRFGFPLNVVYETSDPGIHFWTSLDFMQQSKLLNHVTNTSVDFSTRQFASYTNVGILFKVFNPFIGKASLCNVYVICDLITIFISLILFYILVNISTKKTNKTFIFILSILYMLGYPLNNIIFGFFYSGHAVNIIIFLLIMVKLYKKEYFSSKCFVVILIIINITIFFTYYFYVPVVYASEFIYLIYENKKNLNKKFFLNIILVFVIPTIIGIFYFVIPNIGNNDTNVITQIGLDGYYYSDVISNFALFWPFVIYYLGDKLKNKTNSFLLNLIIISFVFIFGLFIFVYLDVASLYYLSKMYYLIWFLMFYIMGLVFDKLIINNRLLVNCFLICFILLCLNSIFNFEGMVINKNKMDINKREKSHILDIYNYNFEKINSSKNDYILTSNELKLLNNLEELNPTNVITTNNIRYQKIWIDALFWKEKINTTENMLYEYLFNMESISLSTNILNEINKSRYNDFLIFKRDSYYELSDNINIKIYQYEDGIFIRKD